ncbi:MAG: glycoside hydrolase family 26 protein [Gaiellales bacterium]
MATLAAAVLVLIGLQLGLFDREERVYAPWPVPPAASATVDIGVTTLPLGRNAWRPWQQSDLNGINALEHAIQKHISVVMWYADWANNQPNVEQLEAVAARGSTPEITWEPWDALNPVRYQPRYRLQNIVAGHFDSYIRAWANTLAAYERPVRLRFAQEMNGGWYPWSERSNGNLPHEFVRAWRHIHDIFRAVGATNVEWVWSPAAITINASQYPGDAYVDLVSLSTFNGDSQLRYSRWRPFAQGLSRSLARLRAIAPTKPIEISEIGVAGTDGSKAAWIGGMFETLRRNPSIVSVIWYDLAKESDWRFESGPRATAAFAAGVAHPRYR